jgi:hypothetical protein
VPKLALIAAAGLFAGVLSQPASAALVTGDPSLSSADAQSTLVRSTLYETNTIFTGVSMTRVEFAVPSAGQLQVTLTDLEFPALAGALSFALVQEGSVLGLINGGGMMEMDFDGPQTLFGYVYGVGAPSVSTASFFLNISHEYAAPIPLPAAVWVFLGGLGLTGWVGRRRSGADAGRLEAGVAG